MDNQDLQAIKHLANNYGFAVILKLLDEHIKTHKDHVYNLMSTKAQDLTGRKAISEASKARSLEDFKEELMDAVRMDSRQGPKG